MLWVWIAMFSTLHYGGPRGVELKFASREFLMESGEAIILHSDSFAPPGDHLVLPNGSTVSIPEATAAAEPLALRDGSIQGVPFARPGKYMAILMNLVVLRFADQKSFHVRQFSIGEFALNESDLRSGVAKIVIEPGGVFRVSVSDRQGRPAPARRVSFSKAKAREAGAIRLIQVESDNQGEIIMLGRPGDFHISAPGEEESLVLKIDPL